MKTLLMWMTLGVLLFFQGCSQKNVQLQTEKKTVVVATNKEIDDDFDKVLQLFQKECALEKVQALYKELCKKSLKVTNAKSFIQQNFDLYRIEPDEKGLLTGYYEASLRGSLKKHAPFVYPVYTKPKDLVTVELATIYPKLRNLRLRGRIEGDKLVPYYTRKEQNKIQAEPICYVDDRIQRFFLEIQGSGRIKLDTNETIYVSYADQNGHRYTSIGKYMIAKGYLEKDEVSMQRIERFLKEHPEKIDEILGVNESLVFFKRTKHPATGALGIELTPLRSVAVDSRYIPLGAMLYYESPDANLKGIVFAQDRGGAIKGAVRADLFTGYGTQAEKLAGFLKSPLKLWIFLPKKVQ